MKQDLDNIMQARNIDALLVSNGPNHNAAMYYFTGDVHFSNGVDLFKVRGQEPIVFYHDAMEREEAAKSGLKNRHIKEYDFNAIFQQAEGDIGKALALRYKIILEELGVSKGRIAIYGKGSIGEGHVILSHLENLMPDIELVAELGDSALSEAMETKDEQEAARIRKMGDITTNIVTRVADFIRSHKAKDNTLIKEDGTPLTIRDIKNNINLWAVEAGVENPHDCIFAIGRDAGIPHSVGNLDDTLDLGKTIIFDIFLQEPRGGYHYDFTRTWCIGHAPQEVQKIYDDVYRVFNDIMSGLEANALFYDLFQHSNQLFEDMGYPTTRSHPGTQDGYVHSLGHGLGLELHEAPSSRNQSAVLKPGVVVTIEPGLYFPDKGIGVRIEDTVYVQPDGSIEVMADYPHDLVLEIDQN